MQLPQATIAILAGGLCWLAAACGSDVSGSNGLDDDFCHGQPDRTRCDDGEVCTTGDICGNGVCLGRPVADGEACDDGDACTLGDACAAGVCATTPVACDTDLACQVAACDPATGLCGRSDASDGTVCDAGGPGTTDGRCDEGSCVVVPEDCAGLGGPCEAVTNNPFNGACVVTVMADASPCDDGDACTETDRCAAGVCVGADVVCAAEACREGVCDATTGACGGSPLADGTPCDSDPCSVGQVCLVGTCTVGDARAPGAACDDGDACTTGETCTDGACDGGVDLCVCAAGGDGTACDDRDPCTIEDACLLGSCVGTSQDCTDLDAACVIGACDATTGDCEAHPRPDDTACDDGSLCTMDDACTTGACSGSPVDCAEADGDCLVGVCDTATGACVATQAADSAPCSDGNACSAPDTCVSGTCVGGATVCGPCLDKAEGDACDDMDACTPTSTCTDVDGDFFNGPLACQGVAIDCSDLDGPCTTGVCASETGVCAALAFADGLACELPTACALGALCSAGVCDGGTPIELCGAAVDQCEPQAPNDVAADAIALVPVDGRVVAFGTIDPTGDADWYAVTLSARQILSVQTGPHCASELDTTVGVYRDDGTTLVAMDDDGAGAPWSALEIELEDAGVYRIAVTALASSGSGTYLLDVGVVAQQGCEVDADCGCVDLRCDVDACVSVRPLEVEPNDVASADLVTLPVDGELGGTLSHAADRDLFRVALLPGQPIVVETAAICESLVNPMLTIRGAAGVKQLARDRDGLPGGHARISQWFAPSPAPGAVADAEGRYPFLVEVAAEAVLLGDYVVKLSDAQCTTDADCTCVDQVCSAPGALPLRRCVPERDLDAASSEPSPVAVNERWHGAIEPAFETDTVEIGLQAGTYDVETMPYCGSALDTRLVVRDAAGMMVASDDDGGAGRYSKATLTVGVAGIYQVTVSGSGPVVGRYVLRVAFSTEP